jgi:hypothetical protein
MRASRIFTVLLIGFVGLGLGCGSDHNPTGPDLTTSAGVMKALETAYSRKDRDAYAALLAEDFRFYFENDTRAEFDLPEFWTLPDELSATQKIFSSTRLRTVDIELSYTDAVPANEVDRETWLRSSVTDTHLELALAAGGSELEETTLIIDGQAQLLYLRKGKNPADTLATSATSDRLYIVEWHDQGTVEAAITLTPKSTAVEQEPVPVRSLTWSGLKMYFKNVITD